ncbi:hypothetical protein HZH68_001607 [Vespula germanica]|uniref:Uncharacterized protein n=1 Tax=Vespula germanica TaxID=30212 RepID=A0A834U6W1_VESGE|nr:hypothetical protein HZH68_001607 [Vespula germanica]
MGRKGGGVGMGRVKEVCRGNGKRRRSSSPKYNYYLPRVNPNCPVEANASSTAIFLLSVLSAFARARRHQVRAIGATVAAAVAGIAVETAAVAVVVVVASD